jgi:hypothetical protein
VQIGHEGGVLPNATVILNKPIDYDYNRGSATVLNVELHTVYLGPAERADIIVDFTQFAGRTIILYNDCPAPTPAGAPYYDYFTCGPDNTPSGGAASTLPGKGPNTRTMMQIRVAGTKSATPPPANAYDPALLTKLQAPATGIPKIFATVQDKPVVPQPPYEPALGPTTGTTANWYSRVDNNTLTFTPYGAPADVTMSLVPKAIAEEMDFIYARMNATLGVEMPFTGAPVQTTIWYGLIDPATEIFNDQEVQLWKLTHNGVDTHAIHFHIVNVQIVNRVGWDNWVKPPYPEELGWKDTIKMNPLEDIIFATRAKTPTLPFKLPNSKRHLNPEQPTGSTIGFMNIDPVTSDPITVVNEESDFGWEYVWHCHLLGHEEYDMMRPFVVVVSPEPVTGLTGAPSGTAGTSVALIWNDNSPQPAAQVLNTRPPNTNPEQGFYIQRAPVNNGVVGAFATIRTNAAHAGTGPVSFTDTGRTPGATYAYRVVAFNKGLAEPSNVAIVNTLPPPAAPTSLQLTLQAGPQIRVTFVDNANNESGFQIERSINGGAFALVASPGTRTGVGSTVTFTDTSVSGANSYTYRARAVNGGGQSTWLTTTTTISVPAAPAAPSNLRATAIRPTPTTERVTLTWTDNANNETGFTIQRSASPTFNTVSSSTLGANVTTYTSNPPLGTWYYRLRANNGTVSSAWVNATPFPVPQP